MLDSERKSLILANLSRLYHLGDISKFIERYSITMSQLVRWASREYPMAKEEFQVARARLEAPRPTESPAARRLPSRSTVFGALSLFVTIALFALYRRELANLFNGIGPIPELFLGVLSSLLASVAILLIDILVDRKRQKEEKHDRAKYDNSDGPFNPTPAGDG
jgi:hypothetical protein